MAWSNPPTAPVLRANAAAAVAAGVLALVTVVMIVWFAFQDIVFLENGMTGGVTGMVLVNVLGGTAGAASLLVAAGFTFARRIPGAWTLCGLCTVFVVANTMMGPLLWDVSMKDQLDWIFGFHKSNGTAVGLATIFGVLTAITAAIAGSVKSYEPTTGLPPQPCPPDSSLPDEPSTGINNTSAVMLRQRSPIFRRVSDVPGRLRA